MTDTRALPPRPVPAPDTTCTRSVIISRIPPCLISIVAGTLGGIVSLNRVHGSFPAGPGHHTNGRWGSLSC